MELEIDKLGKVSITVEPGYWNINEDYDKLTVVEKEGIFGTYISRKPVPAGTSLTDREYWIPFSSLKEEIIVDYNAFIDKYKDVLAEYGLKLEDHEHRIILLEVIKDTVNTLVSQSAEYITIANKSLTETQRLHIEISDTKKIIDATLQEAIETNKIANESLVIVTKTSEDIQEAYNSTLVSLKNANDAITKAENYLALANDLTEVINSTKESVVQQNAKINELYLATLEHHKLIDASLGNLTETKNKVDQLAIDLETLLNANPDTAINSFNEIIAFLEGIEDSTNLDNIIASIETQISSVETKTNSLNTQLNEVNTQLSDVKTKITSIDTELDSANDKIDSIETKLNSTEEKITSIEENINSTEENINLIKEDITSIEGSVNSINTKLDDIDDYTINGKKINTNPTITKDDINLNNVDNTSDFDKPISNAAQEALDNKLDKITNYSHVTKTQIEVDIISPKKHYATNASKPLIIGKLTVDDVSIDIVNNIHATEMIFGTFNIIKDENGNIEKVELIDIGTKIDSNKIVTDEVKTNNIIFKNKNIEENLLTEDQKIYLNSKLNALNNNNTISFKIRNGYSMTDPDSMVSDYTTIADNVKIQLTIPKDDTSDRNFLTWLKANTHAYVGKYVDGGMKLKQLSDSDRNFFVDGTSATSYITNTEGEYDVFVKFPCDIYYKWDYKDGYNNITFTKEIPNDIDNWQKWDKNHIIGIYEASFINNKLYSISGHSPVKNKTFSNCKNYISSRGEGFRLITYEFTKLLAFLFYGYYGSLNSQEHCGYGTTNNNSNPKITGITDTLNSIDTNTITGNGAEEPDPDQLSAGYGSDIKSTNFWFIENFQGNKYEYLDNISIYLAKNPNSNSPDPSKYLKDYITTTGNSAVAIFAGEEEYIDVDSIDDFDENNIFVAIKDKNNNPIRFIVLDNNSEALSGYVRDINYGKNLDIIGTEFDVSDNTCFCDTQSYTITAGHIGCRSGFSNDPEGGVACLYFVANSAAAAAKCVARIMYEGTDDTIQIVETF